MPPWEYFYRSVNLLHFEEQNFTVHQIAAICDDIYIEDLECTGTFSKDFFSQGAVN